MKTVFADFNALTEDDRIRMTTRGSEEDLRREQITPGNWVWLSDGELQVGAKIAEDARDRVVAIPAWETLVDLQRETARPFEEVWREFSALLQSTQRSRDDEIRLLQLLSAFETLAPAELRSVTDPGYFASRRAAVMLALGWFELARLSIEEALHSLPETPFYVILHLEILRRLDLQLAVAEAERWVAAPATDARILAACLNVLAIQADNLPDDQIDAFRSLFEDAIQRFDRAPGRGAVDVSTLALLLVNCGLLALRSGRIPEARDVFHLARQIDPNDPDVRVFSQVESFDDMARQAASRLHARPIDRQMAA